MTDHPEEHPDTQPESSHDDDWAPPTEASAPPPAAQTGSGIPWRLTLFLLLTVVVVIFAVQNTQDVQLRFLGWSWTLPLVIIILIAVVVSVILDEVLGGIIKRQRLKRHRERAELERLRSQSS